MQYLTVKNWEKFQHYRHRGPKWIKLHSALLDDYDFECLPDASKLLAVCIWMLASRVGHDRIPNDPAWLNKHLPIEGKIDLTPLIQSGYLECLHDASTMLADCVQDACSEKSRVEKSREEYLSNASTLLAHYRDALGRKRYELTPERSNILRAALDMYDLSVLQTVVTVFATNDRYKKSREGKFDGLCEYIIAYRLHKNTIRERVEDALRVGGYELVESKVDPGANGDGA